ncbi:hypothetical protein [Vibrio ostreae]|uniref:Uncharacterized protein n=1 Tax=Vibrio ostreae TaxID=2841925 RepID=A0A975U8M1_9VIBR|nr:hypothetical protein [Vibrio ostreae]QXO16940.1 hypothetical protein KNV97_15915 [Vibrio ostreae]
MQSPVISALLQLSFKLLASSRYFIPTSGGEKIAKTLAMPRNKSKIPGLYFGTRPQAVFDKMVTGVNFIFEKAKRTTW